MRKKGKKLRLAFLISFPILILMLAWDGMCKVPMKEETKEHIQETEPLQELETECDESAPNEIISEEMNTDETVSEGLDAVEEDFSDALFIGDSRTIGLMQYGNMEHATFFADSGMSVFLLEIKSAYNEELGKTSFDELLEKKSFGKIFLMLGINELGYSFEKIQKKYQEILEKIIQKQDSASIYLCANLHVTAKQSQQDEIYNNENINRVNEMISNFADGETIFYIDVNELFDDENGCLSEKYASDSFHIWGKYYADWVEWLREEVVS